MSANEKISLWDRKLEDPEDDPIPNENADIYEASADNPMNQDSDEESEEGKQGSDTPQLLAYRSFISKAPAYEWLLARLRREFLLAPAEPNYMEAIRREIIKFLPSCHKVSRTTSAEAYTMTFVIEWDPLAFVKEQMYKEEPDEAVEMAITLTGSAKHAQALTCAQYLCQVWPSSGEYIIRLVKDVVRSGPSHRHTCKIPCLK